MTFCSIWQFNINTFWTARIWPAWSFNSDRTKHTPSDFQCQICLASVVFLRLFFKLKVSSWAFLEVRQIFLQTHCRFELNFMTSWGMVSDKVIVVSAYGILLVCRVWQNSTRSRACRAISRPFVLIFLIYLVRALAILCKLGILEVPSADTTITLSFLLAFSAATTKDDDYGREWHSCRWCTTLVTRKVFDSFGSIRNGRHLFCFFFVACQPPSGPEVKWNA